MFLLMQNIFIVAAMQHGCRAKPLLCSKSFPIVDGEKEIVYPAGNFQGRNGILSKEHFLATLHAVALHYFRLQ